MRLLFQVLCLSLLVSCTSINPQQALLNHADSLMQVQPDSALAFLERVEPSGLTIPAAKARYAVLFTQAKDKNYIRLTDDSLIRTAVTYYDSVGDVGMQAKAHYYLGRVHQDKKEKIETAQEYCEALFYAEKLGDKELLTLTLGNLGHLFAKESLYDKADSLYRRAECLAVIRLDSLRLATFLTMRGRIYAEKGLWEENGSKECYVKSKYYYDQALRIAKKTKNERMIRSISVHLNTFLNIVSDELQPVALLRNKVLSLKDTVKHHEYYLALGNLYYKSERYDSAVYFYSHSLLSQNFYVKAGAANQLSNIAVGKGDLYKALYWKNLYTQYKDTAVQSERSINMIITEHNLKTRQYNEQNEIGMSEFKYFLFFLLLLILGIVLFGRNRMRKHQEEKHALENSKQVLEEKAARSEAIEEELLDKDQQLKRKNDELSRMQGMVDSFEKGRMEVLVLQSQIDILCIDRQEIFLSQFRKTAVYKSLLTHLEDFVEDKAVPFGEDRWGELLDEVNRILVGFSARLLEKYPTLNVEDVRFCCLLKVGLTYVEAAKIFARTANAMYKRRNSIIEKMGVNVKEMSLEDVILRV